MVARQLHTKDNPLALELCRMGASFFRLQCAAPETAARVADRADVVLAVWAEGPGVIGCLPARGGERVLSGESGLATIVLLVEDGDVARWLAGGTTEH